MVGASETAWEVVVAGTRGVAIETERGISVQNGGQRKNSWILRLDL